MGLLVRLRNVRELPTLPEILLKVQASVDSEQSDAASLAAIIEEDPSLASKVLRIANSSFYLAPNNRISSVVLAVARIGFHEVRNVALAASLVHHFTDSRGTLSYRTYWMHCIAAAHLCRAIVEESSATFDQVEREQLFLAGLFHDIGILVLDQFFHETFETIMQRRRAEEQAFVVAEAQVLGGETHPVIGGALLEIWKLSSHVVSAVRYHHQVDKSPENHKRLAAIVAIAEYALCATFGAFEGAIPRPEDSVLGLAGLEPGRLGAILELIPLQLEKAQLYMASSRQRSGGGLRHI